MKILIVDNNLELCQVLSEFFGTQPDLQVVGEAHDGEQALKKIQELEPDLVILDITMPHLDGLGVLERLYHLKLKVRPRIIVLTAFGRDDLISRLTELGVDYFILKPFNLEVLAERVRQFSQEGNGCVQVEETAFRPNHLRVVDSYKAGGEGVHKRNVKEHLVTKILHELGVPPHFKGFTYLREAVLFYLSDGYVGGALTKELYPSLASKHNTTSGGVEAAIRNAVVAAWEHGNRDYIKKLCGAHRANRVPTNSLIIAKLAEEVNMA